MPLRPATLAAQTRLYLPRAPEMIRRKSPSQFESIAADQFLTARTCAPRACAAPVSVSADLSLLAHVEQAEARQIVLHEQLLSNELVFHLPHLYHSHSAAVRCKFA